MTLIINDIPEESPDYELQSTGVIERTNALIVVVFFPTQIKMETVIIKFRIMNA